MDLGMTDHRSSHLIADGSVLAKRSDGIAEKETSAEANSILHMTGAMATDEKVWKVMNDQTYLMFDYDMYSEIENKFSDVGRVRLYLCIARPIFETDVETVI